MTKLKIKIIADAFMLALFPFLMAIQVTGQAAHEYIGTAMLILFILHNILNIGWYKAILRGKYTLIRMLYTAVNILLLISMLCTGISGILMSGYAFSFLPSVGVSTARVVHLSASYWGLTFMGLHLGFHWSIVTSRLRPFLKDRRFVVSMVRAATALISVYGAYCFYKNDIASYMLLTNKFVFLDYSQNAVFAIAEIILIITMLAAVGYCIICILKRSWKK